ncbi:MAG: PIN domain-containing protein [Nitrospirae bacterium]|nr:MAG: PIN domain-containing protein [Nitrospirota bacterium]
MLCIDTSTMIAFLEGEQGKDVDLVDQALQDQVGVFSPVVITELLSDPKLPRSVREILLEIPVLPIMQGFWERAGLLRAKLVRRNHKAKLADTLIAQTCLDHQIPLVTRDNDFTHFTKVSALKVYVEPSPTGRH